MEWGKEKIKGLLTVVCGGVAFYVLLQRLSAVLVAVRWILHILSPLLLGGAIAFVLNVPMRCIERKLFPGKRQMNRVRRPLALVLTLMAMIAILILAFRVIGPGVGEAVASISHQVPNAVERLKGELLALQDYLPYFAQIMEELAIDWNSLSQRAVDLIESWGKGLLSAGSGLVSGLVSGAATFVIGLVFSFYMLLQKERLSCQSRQVAYALLPEKGADWLVDTLRLANRTFSGFLSGQCLEALILGTMFVVTMSLFHIPYALLVGVLVALTALIPVVGAFIGCVIGSLLIAITDPWKALIFIVLFFILQQLEGNLIYPHVVGSSVGLPSIWVLAAVTLGGGLFGVAGILLFIPLCSVLYALFRRFIKRRLKEKKISPVKWQETSCEKK